MIEKLWDYFLWTAFVATVLHAAFAAYVCHAFYVAMKDLPQEELVRIAQTIIQGLEG